MPTSSELMLAAPFVFQPRNPLGNIRIENVRAVTGGHAFSLETPQTPGTGAGIPAPPGITVTMRNNVVSPRPGQPLRTIGMDFNPAGFTNKRYEVFVYDYQGKPETASASIGASRLPKILPVPGALQRYGDPSRNRRHHLPYDRAYGEHPQRALWFDLSVT
jgi:hypothetical protein